jgi:hypothetical protein
VRRDLAAAGCHVGRAERVEFQRMFVNVEHSLLYLRCRSVPAMKSGRRGRLFQ